MIEKGLRILLVDDDEDDYIATRVLLNEAFGSACTLQWIPTYSAGLEAIQAQTHDVYLIDFRLGGHSGLDLTRKVSARKNSTTPVILLTGLDDHEVDIAAMNAGAADYLVKQQLSAPLLERAIRYAIERKKTEQELLALAHYDPLTGLANRSLFQVRLADSIAQAKRAGQFLALLLIDLDHFKDINDTLGHAAGDAVLQEIAERLPACLRESDTVARLGGDEFVIIATQLSQGNYAGVVAEQIIGNLAHDFHFNDDYLSTKASIGVALYPSDGTEPDELLKRADLALYQAKNSGRGMFKFFDAQMHTIVQKKRTMLKEMERAMEQHEFRLYFQPMVDTFSEEIVGAEALLRWPHPDHGMIMPSEFIPIAESSGLIIPVGETVLKMACAQITAWRKQDLPPIPIAVNISPRQCQDDGLSRVIQDSGIDPVLLELEITESIFMEDSESIRQALHTLREMGVKLAIDDFGTGFSSLAYLKQFRVDKLKIDRSFISDVPGNPAIVRAIIALGKSLQLELIAEGVETEEQLAFLRQEQCRQAQGYYFSHPLLPDEFIAWCREGTVSKPLNIRAPRPQALS